MKSLKILILIPFLVLTITGIAVGHPGHGHIQNGIFHYLFEVEHMFIFLYLAAIIAIGVKWYKEETRFDKQDR